MNARHDFVSLFIPAADERNAMLVARSRKSGIAFPSVRVDCCARLHGLSNEVQQAFGGDILDAPQADASDSPAVFLCCDHNDGLFLDLAAPLALFRASYDLNWETAMAADKQRRFTDEFKREAVRLVDSGGRGIEWTARDLGISKSSLTRWMSERRQTDLLSSPHDDAQKELARLRRENDLLRAERDLLKKAAAFFAKETSR
jgi:transposase